MMKSLHAVVKSVEQKKVNFVLTTAIKQNLFVAAFVPGVIWS